MKLSLPLVPYVNSVVDEGRKVIWPGRELVIRHTVMVIVSIAMAVIIFGSLDYGLSQLVKLAISKP